MKRKISFLALAAIVSIFSFFHSCKSGEVEVNPEFARYISAFTAGRVSSSSPIYIEMNQDMPSVELNKEIEEDLFDFSPSIKGHAFWTSSRSIKFVPAEGQLKAGQRYTAKFKLDKILKVSSEFKNFKFGFHVPEQDFILNLLPYSPIKDNDRKWNSINGELFLADNADLDKINQMFQLKGDTEKKASIKITPTAQSGKYHVLVDSLARGDSEKSYTLNVNGKNLNIDKKEDYNIVLPGLNDFKVIDTRIIHKPQQGIRVTFSNLLSLNQNIQGLISTNGTVDNFSYDVDKNVLTMYVDSEEDAKNISLKIYKELKDVDGKQLAETSEHALSFSRDMPAIKVNNSGNILPNSDNLIIPFQAVNLWAVDVKIIKIFESNILGYLQANDLGGSDELKRFGRLVLQKRIRLDEDPTLNLKTWNSFSLDLAKLIERDLGSLYRVEFSMKQDYSLYGDNTPTQIEEASLHTFDSELTEEDMEQWDNPGYYYSSGDYDWSIYDWRDRDNPNKPTYYMGKTEDCIVFASNIGLTAKIDNSKQVLVAVNDILTTEPLQNVSVDVYNYQMQKIGSGVTDKHGFTTIEYKGGVPFVVIASSGKEKGYLKVSANLALSLSNFDVSGKDLPKGLKGYIYGERGVWRPGDSIYLSFIIEDKEKMLPKEHPVELEFYTPRGQLHNRTVKTDGLNGFYRFNLSTNSDSETGNWQVKIIVGGVTFTKQLSIETVKPNRLKIRFKTADLIDASKGSISGDISSQWLHGAPAKDLKTKVEMTLSSVSSPFAGYETYYFNNPASNFYTDTYTLYDGRLNSIGEAHVQSKLPQAASAPGLLRANIVSRVFEAGGDASIYAQTVAYSPFSHYVGIRTVNDEGNRWLETDMDNPIEIVSLNKEGKETDRTSINVKAYKLNWSWWWDSGRENLANYINRVSTEIVLDETVSTKGGKAKVNLKVNYPEWGRYLVIAKDLQSGHTTGKVVYMDWPSWRGRSNKQDASGLTMLSFTTDKQSYKVGENAVVTIPQSSAGRALISMEQGGKILTKGWLETSATKDVQHSFKVTEDMAPNFYLTVNMLQPHAQNDNDLPIRLYGVQNISVKDDKTILEPVIKMPDELRPEKEFIVNVSEKSKRGMTYTIAIVDEGLLDLTAFRTPNAWNDFYARQALSVRMWDMYDMVIGKTSGKMGPLLSIGGDEALKSNTSPMSRFKPVVKFYGPFQMKAGDVKQHKITLPPYFGAVRAMVVAGDGKGAYGKAEKSVQVKNPLMVLSTLPRVAGPDEEILLPVNVFAMNKDVKDVQVTVESNGLFQFVDGKTKSVKFTEEGDKTIYFKTKVGNKTGQDKIVIKATGGGESVTETIDIEVRNPNPEILLSDQGTVAAGDTKELSIELDDPRAEDWIKMEVSRMPSVNLNQNLAFLMQYPHGCTEQVTSRVFPLLYVGTFKKMTDEEKAKRDYLIKEGIKIISSRQLGDGGFVYWPGSSSPTEWVTTYAGHFLVEAKRAGYEVPSSVISKWTRFQKRTAQNWNKRELYNTYYSYNMNDLQQAYRLYSLALAESPELGSMNRLKEMEGITPQTRWRLASAYLISGKKDAAKQLIENASDSISDYSFNNNTYGSSTRDKAMIMETHLLLGNTDKALELSYDVSKTLSNRYISTQDAAFGLIAMARLSEHMGKGAISYEWTLNGVKQTTTNQGAVFQEIDIKTQKEANISFTNNGEGKLFVRLLGKTQPLGDKVPAKDGDVRLFVRYVDENDNPIDVSELTQGTEFFAEATMQNMSGMDITDLAVTQIFASGWEIYNTRLFDTARRDGGPLNYQDIRDDRVMSYFNLNHRYNLKLKIRLQAAYIGKFYLPGVSCETMYNPNQQSRTSGQWVEVKQPK